MPGPSLPRDPTIVRQVRHFFVSGLHDADVRLAVRRASPQDIDAAYKRSREEQQLRAQDDEDSRDIEPMDINHMRRRKGQTGPQERRGERRDMDRRDHRTPTDGRRGTDPRRTQWHSQPTCWNCGSTGHIRTACKRPAQGNGRPPFADRPASGRRL